MCLVRSFVMPFGISLCVYICVHFFLYLVMCSFISLCSSYFSYWFVCFVCLSLLIDLHLLFRLAVRHFFLYLCISLVRAFFLSCFRGSIARYVFLLSLCISLCIYFVRYVISTCLVSLVIFVMYCVRVFLYLFSYRFVCHSFVWFRYLCMVCSLHVFRSFFRSFIHYVVRSALID